MDDVQVPHEFLSLRRVLLSLPAIIAARAGLRMGYAIGHPPIIRRLAAFRLPLGIGTPHIAALHAGFSNPAFIAAERKRNHEVRAFTMKAFADMGFTGTDSQSNFIFVNIKRPAAGVPRRVAARPACWWDAISRPMKRPTAACPSGRWPR